jgi:hypothetical protein
MKMKIISCVVFGLIFSSVVMGQEKSIKNIVSLNLQSKQQIDKSQALNSRILRSKNSSIKNNIGVGELYEVNGTFLQVNAETGVLRPNHLEELSKGMYEMAHLSPPKVYNSEVKEINGYKILIINIENDSSEIGRYNFYCITKSNDKILNGVMEYELAEKGKAGKTLDIILKGLKFK